MLYSSHCANSTLRACAWQSLQLQQGHNRKSLKDGMYSAQETVLQQLDIAVLLYVISQTYKHADIIAVTTHQTHTYRMISHSKAGQQHKQACPVLSSL